MDLCTVIDRRWLIERLDTQPLMFSLDGSFDMYVAFLKGYEVGSQAAWLADFQAWLVNDWGSGRNVGWESLILRLALPGDSDGWRLFGPRTDDEESALRETLFSKLRAFDADFPEL